MGVDKDQVIEKIFKSEADIVALASEMIEVPSPTGQEGPMAEWLRSWLGANGFEVSTQLILK